MQGVLVQCARMVGLLGVALAGAVGTHQALRAQQQNPLEDSESMLTYSRGQAVIPMYHGWTPLPDGTVELWFGYLNQNWREELDIPVGPNNFLSPERWGPDAGQPTHFLPRNNRWSFKVTINPDDFPEKEVVWTLTSAGRTYRAYGTLHPGYVKDASGLQREYFGEPPPEGNEAPELRIEGPLARTLKVGEITALRMIATDDGIPRGATGGAPAAAAAPPGNTTRRQAPAFPGRRSSVCGASTDPFFCGEPTEGAGVLFSVKGLRVGCYLYRGGPEPRARGDFGNAALVTFDPPQEKVWEDHRGGSPWATGYRLPPIPPDNTWNTQTSFREPGIYTVRCQAHDGLLVTTEDVTFTVVP